MIRAVERAETETLLAAHAVGTVISAFFFFFFFLEAGLIVLPGTTTMWN